jgi:hypothetical protein
MFWDSCWCRNAAPLTQTGDVGWDADGAAQARLYLYEAVDVIFTPQLPDTQAEVLYTHTLVAEPDSPARAVS